MIRPGHHHLKLAKQRLAGVFVGVDAFGQAAQHQINIAPGELRQHHVAGVHHDGNRHVGMLDLVGNQRGCQEFGHCTGHAAHTQCATQARPQGDHFLTDCTKVGQYPAGIANQNLTIGSRLHAARQTGEQRHAQRAFELLQQFGGGGLAHAHGQSRAPQVALLAEYVQQQQLPRSKSRQQGHVGRIKAH